MAQQFLHGFKTLIPDAKIDYKTNLTIASVNIPRDNEASISLVQMNKKNAAKKEGYVYVLSNPAIPGVVKIGKTTRDPNVRLREINSATGVPLPFVLEGFARTRNVSLTERLIHEELANKRLNQKREFFKVSPSDAIRIAKRVASSHGARFHSQRALRDILSALVSVAAIGPWAAFYNLETSIVLTTFLTIMVITNSPRLVRAILAVPSRIGYQAELFVIIAGTIPIIAWYRKIDSQLFFKYVEIIRSSIN